MVECMNSGIFNISNEIFISGDIHGDYLVMAHILVDLTDTCHKINSDTLEDSKKQEICNGYDFYLHP